MTPEERAGAFDPRAKLALVVAVVLAAIWTTSVARELLVLAGFSGFVLASGAVGFRRWLAALKPILLFVPILVVLNTVFYADGTTWWAVWVGPVRLAVTDGGLYTAALIAVRLLVIAAAAAWFAVTTSAEAFEVGLVELGIPWTVAFLLSLTLRLVPEMRNRFRAIEEAQRSRGLALTGGPISRTRARIPMLVPFFAAVIRYGYELSAALVARGVDEVDGRTSITEIGHGPADYLLYLLAAGTVAVVLAL